MKKNNLFKALIILVAIMMFGIYYFKFSPFITYDSIWYHSYISILSKTLPLSSWDITRGFGFPLILYLSESIFGKSINGINTTLFIFNLLLLYFSYKIIKKVVPKELKPYKKMIIILAYLVLVVFNPIIFGYSHVMLTESIIPFFAVLAVYLSIKISELTYKNKLYYLYVIGYSIICIYTYFIKQPYFVIAFAPLFLNFFIKLVEKFSWKDFLVKLLTIIFIIISLIISIKCWYKVIDDAKENKSNSSETMGGFISNGLTNGINYHYKNTNICYSNLEESTIPKEYKKILKKLYSIHKNDPCKYYRIYDVYDLFNDNKIDTVIFYTYNDAYSTMDTVKFLLTNFIKHPIIITETYIANYLTLIDFYQLDQAKYIPIRHFGYNIAENKSIGLAIYNDWKNYWWYDYSDEAIEELKRVNPATNEIHNMKEYESSNSSSNVPSIVSKTFTSYQIVFAYGFLAVPFLLLGYFVVIIKNRKDYTESKMKKNQLLFVIYGTIFIHLLAHTAVGAIIDRYAYVAYPLLLIGLIIMFIPTKEKKKTIDDNYKNSELKKLNVFIINNDNSDINKILKIKEDTLVISKLPIISKKEHIKVINCPNKFTYNDMIVLLLAYINSNNYNFASLYIDQDYTNYSKIVNNMVKNEIDFSIVHETNTNCFKDIIDCCYIDFFTNQKINSIKNSTLLLNSRSLRILMNNNKFTSKAVIIKKLLDYDIKYQEIEK